MRAILEDVLTYPPSPPNLRTGPPLDAAHDLEIEANRLIKAVRVVNARDQNDITSKAPADLFPAVAAVALAMASMAEQYPMAELHERLVVDRAILYQTAVNDALVLIQRYERERISQRDGTLDCILTQAEVYVREFRALACAGLTLGDTLTSLRENDALRETAPAAPAPAPASLPLAPTEPLEQPAAAPPADPAPAPATHQWAMWLLLAAIMCVVLISSIKALPSSTPTSTPPEDLTAACAQTCGSAGAPVLDAQDGGWRCLCDLTQPQD